MLEPFTPYTEASEVSYRKTRRLSWWGILLGVVVATICFVFARYSPATDQQIMLAAIVFLASSGLIAVSALGLVGMAIERWMRRKFTAREKK